MSSNWPRVVLLVALAAPFASAQETTDTPKETAPKDAPPKEEPRGKAKISLADFEDAFLEVAERVRPGVVAIEVRHVGEDPRLARDTLFSGVVWDAEGTIVALGRDLESASEILVSPFEGEPVRARFVGADDETGLCVLKLDAPAKGLVALEHGPADKLRAGSFCLAVGNPVGLRHSVAFGHVAATNRTVRRGSFVTKDAIQVTLPVNPGDPGGLLADSRGRLVGVLSSALRRAEPMGQQPFDFGQLRKLLKTFEKGDKNDNKQNDELERSARALQRAFEPNMSQLFTQNVSFAIPVDAVAKAVERVKGNRGKPWLGVDVKELNGDDREELGIQGEKGVLVAGVASASPASKANLHTSDVILTWNNEVVKSPRDLRRLVLGTAVGTKVTLEVLREEKSLKLEVTVEGRGESTTKQPEEKKKP